MLLTFTGDDADKKSCERLLRVSGRLALRVTDKSSKELLEDYTLSFCSHPRDKEPRRKLQKVQVATNLPGQRLV